MTRIAALHGAVNLAQGYPDFEPPPELTAAAKRALDGGYNQYSITWGARELRDAIARGRRPSTESTRTRSRTWSSRAARPRR